MSKLQHWWRNIALLTVGTFRDLRLEDTSAVAPEESVDIGVVGDASQVRLVVGRHNVIERPLIGSGGG